MESGPEKTNQHRQLNPNCLETNRKPQANEEEAGDVEEESRSDRI